MLISQSSGGLGFREALLSFHWRPRPTSKLLINLGKRKQSQRKIGKNNNDFVDFSQEQNEKGNYKKNDVEINMNNEELGIRKFNRNTQKNI